ncbi:MAG: AMP-binding protein, partial [Rhizobiaceae bacterium]
MQTPAMRHEIRYKERVVRCFADRPKNLDEMFRTSVSRFPDKDAVVLGDRRVTYRELDGRVDRVASNLLKAGLKPGDRVALLLGNGLEFVYSVLATARAGMIAVPMNIRQKLPEVEFVLNQCSASAIIHDVEFTPNVPADGAVASLRRRYVVGGTGETSFDTLLSETPSADYPSVEEEDTFCLLYTSGTTGKPKGAMLTHVSTIHSTIHFEWGFSLTDKDVSMMAVPASHVTGLVAILLSTIKVGGCT